MAKKDATATKEVALTDLDRNQLIEVLGQYADSLDLYQERYEQLEQELQEIGWIKMTWDADQELSRDGLMRLVELARVMYLKNPLIQHGLDVAADYVWARGASFTAEGPANDILQGFLDNRQNLASFSSHAARIENDKRLGYEANIFFALFTDPVERHIIVRTIPLGEILAGDIIANPEDRKEIWYYKRVWTERKLNLDTGEHEERKRTDYYPDWRYEEATRANKSLRRTTIGDDSVHWDAPVYHLKVGGLADGKFGIPTVYAAIAWARAVTRDMENFATIRNALARFVFQITTKGGKKAVGAAKAKLQSTLNTENFTEGNPPPAAGSTLISNDMFTLSTINRSGAEPDTENGRGLRLMAAAGLGLPETILMGNADVGNLATAKTLDRPTELKMVNRQTLWGDVFADIGGYLLRYVMDAGKLPKMFTPEVDPTKTDRDGNPIQPQEQEQSHVVKVKFPSVLEHEPGEAIRSVVSAATLDGKQLAGIMTKEMVARLVFEILGLEDIDELLEDLRSQGFFDSEGNEGTQAPGEIPSLNPGPLAGPEPPPVPGLATPAQESEYLRTLQELRDAARAAASNGRVKHRLVSNSEGG